MARRRRRSREVITVHSATSSRSLTSLLRTPYPLAPGPLVDVEDRRRHHPLMEWAPPKIITGNPARIAHKNKFSRPHKLAGFTVPGVPTKVRFKAPAKTLLCIRRAQRKEVLFAKRKTRKGAGASRRRRNPFSEVSC